MFVIVYLILSVTLISPPTVIQAQVLVDQSYPTREACEEAAMGKFTVGPQGPLSVGQRIGYTCFQIQ